MKKKYFRKKKEIFTSCILPFKFRYNDIFIDEGEIKKMKIHDLFSDYMEYCALYLKKGSQDYYRKSFKSLSIALTDLSITDTDQFNKNTLNDLVRYYKTKTDKKNSKINDVISALYSAVNRFDDINKLPKRISLIDDTTSFKPLSKKDLNKMMRYLGSLNLNESNNLIWVFSIYLMLDTGVRLNELVNIKTEHVDISNKRILLVETKNSRRRMVSYGVLAGSIIKKVFNKKHEYLLWNALQNKPLQKRSLEHFFEKMNRDLKFDISIHAHRLRKTFATSLLKMGCPLTTIQKLLGHRSITQTMIYLEVDNEMIDKDYREFYPY